MWPSPITANQEDQGEDALSEEFLPTVKHRGTPKNNLENCSRAEIDKYLAGADIELATMRMTFIDLQNKIGRLGSILPTLVPSRNAAIVEYELCTERDMNIALEELLDKKVEIAQIQDAIRHRIMSNVDATEVHQQYERVRPMAKKLEDVVEDMVQLLGLFRDECTSLRQVELAEDFFSQPDMTPLPKLITPGQFTQLEGLLENSECWKQSLTFCWIKAEDGPHDSLEFQAAHRKLVVMTRRFDAAAPTPP